MCPKWILPRLCPGRDAFATAVVHWQQCDCLLRKGVEWLYLADYCCVGPRHKHMSIRLAIVLFCLANQRFTFGPGLAPVATL